ncbi:MAG: hypothetical protein COV52_02360 [Gammaproteobacteria bacterium CG11_big_fil_rev_8_21_14_0_20_46_22]|nr:MAG: hypothetical protein COW05_08400 [Gammaproteobacteria bacterium CG12_big_fil_rev_8_21_14_0_65_46_12]PIR11623.1 MAG: hypothetical protein COV52_02360 [Gammaproteobacteria bacterium CG11_big_fil_rev_8_21_14_0_20_46_22]
MYTRSFEKLAHHLKSGHVYRREDLAPYSKAVDRDLMRLSVEGLLEKVAPGLYYAPKASRFGHLPPNDKDLVKAFLRDDDFLLLSWNDYNSLGLGLTQLYNRTVVYNYKRHGVFKLGNKAFDFRRPARGFPKKLTPAFLLVDLLNNLNELADENVEALKAKIKNKLSDDLLKQAAGCAKQYGKVATKKFFAELA